MLIRTLTGLCAVAAIGIGVWLVLDDNDADGSIPEQLGDLFEPECEEGGSGMYSGIDPASPRVVGDLDRYHGRTFKAVIESRALEASIMSCEVAGGGLMYFELTSRRAAKRAAEAYRGGPVCLLDRGLFDDDFVDGADEQLSRFCEQLDGTVVT